VKLYTLVYNMCNQQAPHCYTGKLYTLFGKSVRHYLNKVSLPAIQERPPGAYLVREVVSQWDDHCLISRWMCNFFDYVNRFYVRRGSLATLEQVCTTAFKTAIFDPIHRKLTSTLMALILADREAVAVQHDRRSMPLLVQGEGTAAMGLFDDHDEKGVFPPPSSSSSSRLGGGGGGVAASASQHDRSLANSDTKASRAERGGANQRITVRKAINVYIAMDSVNLIIYRNTLETTIIKGTAEWYTSRCSYLLSRLNCPQFLKEAEADVAAEEQRITDLFHATSRNKILAVVREKLLKTRQMEILKGQMGLHALLNHSKIQDLARLYKLYSPCGHSSLVNIAQIVREHVSNKGARILADARDPRGRSSSSRNSAAAAGGDGVVAELVRLHEHCLGLVEGPFQGSPLFHKSLKEALEDVVNSRVNDVSVGEMLAGRFHHLLKKGGASKGAPPEKLNQEISQLVALFGYLTDKDHFAEFYRNDLAWRLLHNKSASMDMERVVIGKLKYSCGAQYTSKIEGMVSDAKTSIESSAEFGKWVKARASRSNKSTKPSSSSSLSSSPPNDSAIASGATRREQASPLLFDLGGDFNARVLTSGFWPSHPEENLVLPDYMTATLGEFEKYYMDKFRRRRLKWIHSVATVTIGATFKSRAYEFSVNGFQAAVLLALNEHGETGATIATIRRRTQLEAGVLKRVLLCLVVKSKILRKSPAKDYNDSDRIFPNRSFASAQRRLKVPSHIPAKEKKSKSRKAMMAVVSEDRKGALECAIVRIMKSRVKIRHKDLIQQVISLVATRNQFRPDPRQIKQSIESLMAREYLERDSNMGDGYRYLA